MHPKMKDTEECEFLRAENTRLREALKMMRQLIAELRGGIPEKCDCCDQAKDPNDLNPVSGGEWICNECWDREVEAYNKALRGEEK